MEIASNTKVKVDVSADFEVLSHKALDIFFDEAQKALKEKDVFYIAISGGHTPVRFFELIAEVAKVRDLPWEKVQLFWVDEHCCGPTEGMRKNYKLASSTFLPKITIPAENIHNICEDCHGGDCRDVAHRYENEIKSVFNLESEQLPQFDLIILGMGADGHTGSLFPNSYASLERTELVTTVYFTDNKSNRITFTHPVLCAASRLVILVSGQDKAQTLRKVLKDEPDEIRYPIHLLWPVLDKVTWLIDRNAAELL